MKIELCTFGLKGEETNIYIVSEWRSIDEKELMSIKYFLREGDHRARRHSARGGGNVGFPSAYTEFCSIAFFAK